MPITIYSNYIEKKTGFNDAKETIDLSDFLRQCSFEEVSCISRFGYSGETSIYRREDGVFLVRSQFGQINLNRKRKDYYCHFFIVDASDDEKITDIIEKLLGFYSNRGYTSNHPVESDR